MSDQQDYGTIGAHNSDWAFGLTDSEIATTLEHHARLAPRDATYYALHEAARRLRMKSAT